MYVHHINVNLYIMTNNVILLLILCERVSH